VDSVDRKFPIFRFITETLPMDTSPALQSIRERE